MCISRRATEAPLTPASAASMMEATEIVSMMPSASTSPCSASPRNGLDDIGMDVGQQDQVEDRVARDRGAGRNGLLDIGYVTCHQHQVVARLHRAGDAASRSAPA